MKKLFLFFVLLFTATAMTQDFTIRDLNPRSPNLADNDLMMLSLNASDAYYSFTYLFLRQELDDESWTWTNAHTFNQQVTVGGGGSIFIIGNAGKVMGNLGELSPTTGNGYLRFLSSGQEDTLMTWRKMFVGSNTWHGYNDWNGNARIDGNWDFYGDPVITASSTLTNTGIIDNGATGTFIVGTDGAGTNAGTLFRYNIARDILCYHYDGSSNIDTIASLYHLWNNYGRLAGDNSWSGVNTFTDELISPTATSTTQGAFWNSGGDGSGIARFTYGSGAGQNDTIMTERSNRISDHDYYGLLDYKPQSETLLSGSQTVAVTSNTLKLTAHGLGSTVTNFTGASEGCILYVWNVSASGVLTIADDDTNIECNGDTNITLSLNDGVIFQRIGSKWLQLVPKSDN